VLRRQVFNTPEVVKVYVGSFNTARARLRDGAEAMRLQTSWAR
jgi:hypothetical protein